MLEKTYEKRLSEWEEARFAPPPEAPLSPVEPTETLLVAMRDGVSLYTELFLPDGNKPVPAILIRSPYPFAKPSRTDRNNIPRFLASGYAIAFQNTRGQGDSEGVFRFFWDDENDGYDAIEWIANQPWCNGKVGMMGSSYAGSTQLLAAKAKPPALKCIMPSSFVGHGNYCFPFCGGVFLKGLFLEWLNIVNAESLGGLEVAYGDVKNLLNHPVWGEALENRSLLNAADQVLSGDYLACWQSMVSAYNKGDLRQAIDFSDETILDLDLPMFFTDGWYDMTIGPIDYFSRLEKDQSNNPHRYLLVGPWNHAQTYSASEGGDNDGDRILPDNGALDLVEQRLAFFDRYLKGKATAKIQENRVKVYITGSEQSDMNRWFDFPSFPAPGTECKSLYLHSEGDASTFPGNGTLSWDEPGDEPVDHYTYDPDVATQSPIGTSEDRRGVEVRADVLTYTSEPFSTPLTILGDISLILHAATDCPDTDWMAVVTEVFPNGESKQFHYAPAALRASYQKEHGKAVSLKPNKPEKFTIAMGPAGHQIAEGNRIRLSIFSAAFPYYEANTNTGKDTATDRHTRIAQQSVYHNQLRPSYIELPIINLNE